MRIRLFIFAWAVMILAGTALADDDGGAESVFNIGSGARAMGMGNSFTALSNDASTIYYNPAGLTSLPRQQVTFLHTTLFESSVYDYVAYAYPTSDVGSFGVAMMRIGTDDIGRRDNLTDIGKFSANRLHLLFSYGRQISSRLSSGLTLKLAHQSIDNYSDYGFGFDLGARAHLSDRLLAGITLQDIIGARIKLLNENERTPFTLKTGLAWLWGEKQNAYSGVILIDFDKPENRDVKIHTGLEVNHRSGLSGRAGYDRDNFTMGMGLLYQDLHFDYAYKFINRLTDSHRFSLTYDFGNIRSDGSGAGRYSASDLEAIRSDAAQSVNLRLRKRLMEMMAFADKQFAAGDYRSAYENYLGANVYIEPGSRDARHIENQLDRLKVLLGDAKTSDLLVSDSIAIDAMRRRYQQQADSLELFYQAQADLLVKQIGHAEIETTRQLRIQVLLTKGLTNYLKGRNKTARADFSAVLALDKENAIAREYLSLLRNQTGKPTSSEDLQQDPVIWQFYLDGLEAFTQGDYAKAIRLWEKVLEKYPNSQRALDNIEQARLRLQN